MTSALDMDEDVLVERLERWLQGHLPEAQGIAIAGVELPDNGASNLTGLIDAGWKESGALRNERLVLRTVSNQPDKLYENYDLAKQYRIMDRLKDTPVLVPRLLAYEPDTSVIGREFYVMYNTGGKSVPENPSYHSSGWFAELTDRERLAIWTQAIGSIATIHQLDWQALGLGFVVDEGSEGSVSDQFLARHSGLLHWMERRNGKEYPRLRRIFDWLELNFPRETPIGLLWADAKLGNLMVDQSKVVGVLDWEHCTVGPRLYDVANWLVFDRLMSQGVGVPRLSGLPDREESIKMYELAGGTGGEDIAYFELFSAVRLSNVMYGVAARLIAAGLVDAEFEENNSAARILNAQLESMGLSF